MTSWCLEPKGDPPAVSVLMAARDAAATIDECLESIAAQTLKNFELVVIDDGSKDDTADRIAAFARRDPRLRLLRRERRGLVPALNEGLAHCLAPLVARMDADDRMHPERLARQLEYLQTHPEVDAVGSRVRAFPREKQGPGMREYLRWQNRILSPADMAADIYVESPLTQPSATFRRRTVTDLGAYRDGDFPEDYELWLRIISAGRRIGKCAQTLLEWRQREDSYSRTDPRFSRQAFNRLRARYLASDPRLNQGRELVIWGAGRVTRKRCRHLLERGHLPCAWVDIDSRKIGGSIDGVPVVAPGWLAARGRRRPLVLVYVARHGAREAIAVRLESMGYLRGRDYLAVG